MNIIDVTERGVDRAAGATAEISLVAEVEVSTRPSSPELVLDRKAGQEDYVHRPGSAEDRLISLQARLLQLEQLNSRLKNLKKETLPQQKGRGQSLSSETETDSDIFLRPRESATIHSVYDSTLISVAGAGRTMQTEKSPIEEWKTIRGDGKHAAAGHRASFKIEPENAMGGSHSRDENFNPSSVDEDLASRKTRAVESDIQPASEHSRPTPYGHNDALNAMKKNAESKQSSRSLNVNSRSAARSNPALHASKPSASHCSPRFHKPTMPHGD